MNNVKLTKAELIKGKLYLKFEGVCGVGTSGNVDAEYIIKSSRDKLSEFKSVQALIFDFTELKYKFGNRFLNLFEANAFRSNSLTPISIIANQENLNNWKSLYEYGGLEFDFYGTEKAVFQNDVASAIKSINKRFNEKKTTPNRVDGPATVR